MRAESFIGFDVFGKRSCNRAAGKRRPHSPLRAASKATVEQMEQRLLMSASLIKDINAVNGDADPTGFATSTNALYFTANDGIHGSELWQTDATAAGTKPAVSLVPGAPQATMSDITVAQGLTYFFAQGPSDGNLIGFYQSSGSPASTIEIGRYQQPSNLTYLNGALYFTVYNGSGGEQIWSSFGTAASTRYLATAPAVSYLTGANSELYFMDGTTLWKSDGTQTGTAAVASVALGAVNRIQAMTSVNGHVYIINAGELFTSDGTAAGTTLVEHSSGAFVTDVSAMANYNGALYFVTDVDGESLWKTDGTNQGTVLVDTISASGTDINPTAMEVVNSTLYFDATDPSHGDELWRSDGTTTGTQLVADINPGPADGFSFPQEPAGSTFAGPYIGQFDGIVYFGGTDGLHGVQLWRSDGTAAGTYQVDQINTLTNSSNPNSGLTIGSTTYFSANDGIHGYELWKTDGTANGTSMVTDLVPGPGSSDPQALFNFNGTLYFVALQGNDTSLYKTDGTAAGTTLIYQGKVDFEPNLTQVGNSLYFFAIDPAGNTDLFRTDGTAAGTVMIQTVEGPGSPHIGQPEMSMANFDGSLYFTAQGSNGGLTLWKSPSNGGTTEIAAFTPGAMSYPDLTVVKNTLYFVANDVDGDSAVWKSDGTPAGTYMVQTTGASGLAVNDLYAFDDALYFTVGSTQYPMQDVGVYRTDGTSAGTVELAPIIEFGQFAAAGGKLYFDAINSGSSYASSSYSLYTTDGTPAGTRVVNPAGTSVSSIMPANGLLYFVGTNGSITPELWQTDGTNTSLVDPSETTAGWQTYGLIGQVNNTFLFSAYDSQHGVELWGALLTPSATSAFAEADTSTSGNWTNAYGADGYAVMGGATSLPFYVTMSTSDASFYQWASPQQADSRAPQTGPWSASYEAGTDYADSSFSVNLNFSDGQSHDVAFYLLDYDRQGRVETVQISNAHSGQVLDTRTISNFSNGQYLVYSLSGDVTITFINAGPQNAVLSAILFGLGTPYAPTTASFAGVDTTTQGQWSGVYGSQGYQVAGAESLGGQKLGGPYDFGVSGSPQFYQWATSTTDRRDPQTAPGSGNLVAACDYSYNTPFGYYLKFLDGQTHQVALYLLDWDYLSRNETITVSNALTGQVLDTEDVTKFSQGVYLRWDVSGYVQINITNSGGLNAVVSGLFIDAPSAAQFVKADSATLGSYAGVYGLQGYDVINSAESLPSYASLTFSPSATPYTWAAGTTAASALQDSPGSSSRIAACVYSQGPSFSFNLDLTDGTTHQVALYVLDWDARNRAETIEISDARTGQVVDSENVSNFTSGKYLVWNLSGDLNITITNTGGLNEVLSGIFFG